MNKNANFIGVIAATNTALRFFGAHDAETFRDKLKSGDASVSFRTDADVATAGVAYELRPSQQCQVAVIG